MELHKKLDERKGQLIASIKEVQQQEDKQGDKYIDSLKAFKDRTNEVLKQRKTNKAYVSIKFLERLIDLQNDIEMYKLDSVPKKVLTHVNFTLNTESLSTKIKELGQLKYKGIDKITLNHSTPTFSQDLPKLDGSNN